MNSFDLKKLITGFLLLSAITSTLTLIFLNLNGSALQSSPDTTEAENQNSLAIYGEPFDQAQGKPSRTIGKNAFVEQLPQTPIYGEPSRTIGQTSPPTQSSAATAPANDQPIYGEQSRTIDTSNLTKNFARIFAQQVISNNPTGPQLDADGKPTALSLPNEDYAAAMFQQAAAGSNFTIDEKIADADLNIIKNYAPEDLKNYFDLVNATLADFASSTSRIDTANPSSTPETIAISQLMFEGTLAKLKTAAAPQPLADFHRSVLGFFANQAKVFVAASNYQTDPLKAVIALKNEGQIISRDLRQLQDEKNKIRTLSFIENGKKLSLLDTILGVQKAQAEILGTGGTLEAILGVEGAHLVKTIVDWVETAAKWVKDELKSVADWLYETALRIAVNVLIDQFQNSVVNWIAGNGDPKFITDWQGFLTDVADKAVGQALFEASSTRAFCSGFGPLIRAAFLPVTLRSVGVRCTLTQVIANVQNFYNNFQNGGWIYYGATLQPQNNFFGNLIQINDDVLRKVGLAEEAAKSRAVANQGFKGGGQANAPGRGPNGGKCVKSHIEGPDPICNPETGDCGPDERKTVCDKEIDDTPGAAVGNALFGSMNLKQNQIVNARRFEELAAALVNAAVSRVIKEGLSALTAATNPSSPHNVTPDQAQSGHAPTAVFDPGNFVFARDSLNNLINLQNQRGVFTNIQNTVTADGQWLGLQPQTISSLTKVTNVCPAGSSLVDSANQNIDHLNAARSGVEAEWNDANDNTIDAFRTATANASSAQAVLTLTTRLQNLDLNAVSSTAIAAQARLGQLQNLQANAQANLNDGPKTDAQGRVIHGPACNVPL